MFKNLSTDGLGVAGGQSEIIELALSYGFKGIDLDLLDFQAQVQARGLPHARRLLDSARLKVGAFRLPLVWDDDDATYRSQLAALPKLLELAASLGATRAVTLVAPANDLRPYHENFEFHRRRLSEIADVLTPHGIRLGLEFSALPGLRRGRAFQFIAALDALALLAGMLRSDAAGVVVDLWQLHVAGGSLEQLGKLGADRIVSVVVSDAPADRPAAGLTTNERLLPGEGGAIDATAALAALAEMGYDGPVTPRADASQYPGVRRDALVKLAGERLNQMWKSVELNAAGKLASSTVKK